MEGVPNGALSHSPPWDSFTPALVVLSSFHTILHIFYHHTLEKLVVLLLLLLLLWLLYESIKEFKGFWYVTLTQGKLHG